MPLGLVVLLLVGRFVDETPRRSGRFDLVGAASATIGAVSLVWALIGAPEHGWGSVRTVGGFVLGAALLLLLARTETRHPHPMVQPHLVRNRRRVGALASMALIIGANLSMFFLVVQYIQLVLGFGPLATGIAFLPFSLGIFGMSRITPWLIARVGPRAMLLTATSGLVVAYAWLSGAGTDGTYLGTVFGPMLIAGLATGLAFMPITATVLAGVEHEHAGSASGLLQTTQQLGSAVGVAVIVSVYAAGAEPGQFVPGPPAGVAHLRRLRGPGAARRGDRAPQPAGRGRGARRRVGGRAGRRGGLTRPVTTGVRPPRPRRRPVPHGRRRGRCHAAAPRPARPPRR